jgi:translocation and assembly module TamA
MLRLSSFGSAAVLALAASAALTPATAATPVEIVGAEREIERGVKAVLPSREEPKSLFDAERIADEAADIARAWLRAEGWYASKVEVEAEEIPPKARIRIDAGRRFALAEPNLNLGGEPEPAARKAAEDAIGQIKSGEPARAATVLNAESSAVAALRERGYAHAAAGERRVVVDHATGCMTPYYTITAGDAVKLGALELKPPGALRPDYPRRATPWKPGDRFTPETLSRLRRDLASTGAFALVDAQLQPAPNENGLTDVDLKLETAKPRVIEAGLGYGTGEGVSANSAWTRRNVTRRADSLTIGTVLAEQLQSLSANLTRPNAIASGKTLRLTLEGSHDATGPYEAVALNASAAIEAATRLRFGLSYGVSVSATSYADAPGVNNALVGATFADARWDHTDNPLDARHGFLVQARLEPSVSTGDATTVFARATGQARGYYTPDFYEKITLAARLRGGWAQPIVGDDSDLPLDRLFYAGGGGSVRGYAYQSIYPFSNVVQAEPPGGLGLAEASVEARQRITDKLGVVAFVDGGSAFNDASAMDLQWGAGVGVRYDLGFAPLRLDVATPLNPRDDDEAVAFYVSIGQAF